MKEKLVKICEKRMDDIGRQIVVRLSNIIDLVAAEGKYHLSCYKNLVRDTPGSSKDSQEKDERQSAFLKLCSYMESSDDCQFSLGKLAEKFEEFCDTKESYVLTGVQAKDTIITLTDTVETILTEKFYTEKCDNIYQEKLRIVEAAAQIIRDDIKRQVYNLEKYPSFDENMRDECKSGIEKVKVAKVSVEATDLTKSNVLDSIKLDILWTSGYCLSNCCTPNWNGVMSLVLEGTKPFEKSKIVALPFTNLSPTGPSTICTALEFALSETRKNHQQTCIVTFDQPLFQKASEIVYAEEMPIILRLGGFHLLMSFMGAVGFIMTGSGLEDLWAQIYARVTVSHMVAGHAYSRAIRAHFLTHWALTILIMDICNDLDKTSLST
ncbi:unnamed protein product [Ceutorhynchus assimilis]|uniref:Uncharacterized protein n=1 Tax=Ceutorhynchus assimilis TaxID=467358 RepID=A0A9N9QJY8_9CUCU|nr:unnamed protein product [Ceutorhynchus assimilis]